MTRIAFSNERYDEEEAARPSLRNDTCWETIVRWLSVNWWLKITVGFVMDSWDSISSILLALTLLEGIPCQLAGGASSATGSALEIHSSCDFFNTDGVGIALLVVTAVGWLASIVGSVADIVNQGNDSAIGAAMRITKLLLEDVVGMILSLFVAFQVEQVTTFWHLSYWTSVVILTAQALLEVTRRRQTVSRCKIVAAIAVGLLFAFAAIILASTEQAALSKEILVLLQNGDELQCDGPASSVGMDYDFIEGPEILEGERMRCNQRQKLGKEGETIDYLHCVFEIVSGTYYNRCDFDLIAGECLSDQEQFLCLLDTDNITLCYFPCSYSG